MKKKVFPSLKLGFNMLMHTATFNITQITLLKSTIHKSKWCQILWDTQQHIVWMYKTSYLFKAEMCLYTGLKSIPTYAISIKKTPKQ